MAARIGIGLAALGRPAYITSGREGDLGEERSVAAMRTRTADVLDAAYAAGVRYVDCARSYGYAEEFLASWLGSRPDIDDVTVASKWGYRYVGDWRRDVDVQEVKDHGDAALGEQLDATRGLLGGRLAIYQVHSLMPDDPLFYDAAALDRLGRLRESGVRVGFSTSGPRQGETVGRALEVMVGGSALFSVVQSTWNLLETSAGPALADAAAAGLDVVVKEALANGRLAPDSADLPPAVDAIARERGVGVDAIVLAAVLAQPWVARVLSGVVTVDQLSGNLLAGDLQLRDDEVAELVAGGQPAEDYWRERSQRAWT